MSFISRFGEDVTIERGGSSVGVLRALFDPAEHRLYLDDPADVTAGDLAGLRGLVRRVIEQPEVWRNGIIAGVVAQLEEGPVLLPDLGRLSRPNATIAFDRETNSVVSEVDPIWTGHCLVEPAAGAQGGEQPVAEQVVSVQPFTVTVPLDVTDVHPDDLFEVTTSRDGRLVTLELRVITVVASSSGLVRTFAAIDNQG